MLIPYMHSFAAIPTIFSDSAKRISTSLEWTIPAKSCLLGTDAFGRDEFSRVLWGGQISVAAGIAATGRHSRSRQHSSE